jgi:hypothetical protein
MKTMLRGITIEIDTCDLDLLVERHWYLNSRKQFEYTQYLEGRRYSKLLHRMVLERVLRRHLKSGEKVEFINGDKRDYRRANLRIENQNRPKRNTGRVSAAGLRGVSLYKGPVGILKVVRPIQ